MKIAVLTDIHGNAPALKAVLAEIDARNDIEHIYCAGDMIGIGPDTNEVLSLLFSRNDVSMVTGNHDEAILALMEEKEYPTSHKGTKEHHQWVAEHLDRSYIPMLKKLPRMIRKNIEGHPILMIHYHIEPSKLSDPICLDPFSKIVEPSLHHISSLFNEYEARLILFGHHHPVHYFSNEQTIYLNPGSLGCSHQETAPYAIAEITPSEMKINLQEADYDKTSFIASYERLKVPDRDFILKVFHGTSQV